MQSVPKCLTYYFNIILEHFIFIRIVWIYYMNEIYVYNTCLYSYSPFSVQYASGVFIGTIYNKQNIMLLS